MPTLSSTLQSVLSPFADKEWENKINERRRLACLTPLGFIDMPLDGRFHIAGNQLAPIELHDNGKVRVGDHIFDQGTDFDIGLDNNAAICREGEALSIYDGEDLQHLYMYQEGGWRMWGYKEPGLRDAIVSEFLLTRELGARTLTKTFLLAVFAVVGICALAAAVSLLNGYWERN